ncbi:MAG: hypothetical protein KDD34_10140 [Bdellovibrionales bacterium]|nr:hypothetical protein [Bdellovibrionales bacterium]
MINSKQVVLRLFFIILMGALNLSMIYKEYDGNIFLTEEDLLIEEKSNYPKSPINVQDSNEHFIPSYNEWMCFSTENMTLTCSEHVFDEIKKVPMIASYKGNEAFEFEPSSADAIPCEKTLETWVQLFEGQNEFCVLAAYLQELNSEDQRVGYGRTLWILDAIKTAHGYWMNPSLLKRINQED